MEKSAWGQGSLGKVNIITLATLLPTPIIISLVVVAAFNQEKALVGAFSVIVQFHRLIDLRH